MIQLSTTYLSLSSFQLLKIFVSEKLSAFVKFYETHKEFVDELGRLLWWVLDVLDCCASINVFSTHVSSNINNESN